MPDRSAERAVVEAAVKCPKCGEEFRVEYVGAIPDSQIIGVELTHDKNGLPAKVLSGTIKSMEGILVGIASEMGVKVTVFVRSIVTKPGRTTVRLAVVRQAKA